MLDAYAGPVVGVHATRAMRGGRRHLVTASARAVCVWDVTETHVLQTEATRGSRGADADAKAPETTETETSRGDAEVRHVLQTDLPPPPDGVLISNTEMTNATASSITELDHGTPERTNVSSVSSEQANERRTSRDHREVSRFRRDDDAFTCFAIRERENQILVGTAGGNLLALDVFAPSNDGSDEVRPK
jgi:hypothetical protein